MTWIIKENTTDEIKPKKYKIKKITETANMIFKIVGLEYLEEKYDQIDSSADDSGIYLEEREYYGHDIET